MIHVRTFGAVELRRGETEVRSVLSQPKRLALFIHVLLASPSGWINERQYGDRGIDHTR